MSSGIEIVRVEDVTFRYDPDDPSGTPALDRVSVQIARGEFIGLVGQNGSGKTTLARHLNSLLKPTTGTVFIGGRDTRDVEPGELTAEVGYVFQNPDHALFLTSVREEIAYSLSFQNFKEREKQERIDRALEAFGLSALADEHPASLGRGTRRLVILAATYAMAPALLVLDEPTGGLDHRLTTDLIQTLDAYVEAGNSVLLISHDMQLIANSCERILALADGRLIADSTPAGFFQEQDLLDRAGLRAPDVARLAHGLRDAGFSPGTVSLEHFVDQFSKLAGCGGNGHDS